MHTDTSANSIFDGPITNLLSILYILVEVLSLAQAKRGESLHDFKFGAFIGRFSSDSAASTAVKGLRSNNTLLSLKGNLLRNILSMYHVNK